MKHLLISLLAFIFTLKSQDEIIFEQLIQRKPNDAKSNLLLYYAQQFLEKPYVGHTLEGNDNEQLVVNLRELDCVTLVENAWALAITQKSKSPDFKTFQANLLKIRYRNGQIDGYASRLHYFADWIFDHQQRGDLKLMNKEWAGAIWEKSVYFMSKNAQKYRQLADKQELDKIRAIENTMNRRRYYYIPKNEVSRIENKIEDGDIISICTNIGGLDFSHQGFAIKQNGRIHLLHASSELKKVIVSALPLADYLAQHKTQTGIVVSRVSLGGL